MTIRFTRIWNAGSIVLGALCFAIAQAGAEFKPRLPDFSRYMQGRFVYERNCAVCHGVNGKGDGEMGRELVPKPRSFRTGLFKYRSTPPGKLPTDADLENTIRHGVPDTSMPIFDKLSQSDLRAVIEYLKFFSKRWNDPANYAAPMRVPEPPAWISDPLRRSQVAELGRSLYQEACASCHGVAGLGDGPAAVTLVDGWNEPIRPANLRHGNARTGTTPEALHRVLLAGIEGTPMPGYAETMSDEQRWAVIAYLLELRAGAAPAGAK